MRPRAVPLHAALVRPILLGGAERELVIIEATAVFVLLFGVGLHLLTLALAVLLATAGHGALVLAARRDPQMLRV